jgi:sulfite exporter TauE/SafE
VLILLAATSRLIKYPLRHGNVANWAFSPFNKALTSALKNRSGHLVIGILNGFLPCGFVYLALIGSVNTTSVMAGVQYMFWFGIGTVPLMLAATVGAGFLNTKARRKMNEVIPYFMFALGIWFVLRGFNLNIPYLSPAPVGSPPICR